MSWTRTRLRYLADFNPPIRADLLEDPTKDVSFLPMEAIGEDGSLDLERTRPVAEVRNGYSYFEDGDVAIAKVTPCFENGKGAIMRGLIIGAGFGTTELTVLRPRSGLDARFLRYFLASSKFMAEATGAMTGAGGLKRVPDWFVRDYPVQWPDITTQERIASFLDEQTARIDALIAEKARLLNSLEDALEAYAFHYVTEGLTGKGATSCRKEGWLARVPAHWATPKLGYFAEVGNGATPKREVEKYWLDGTIPWVTSTAINDRVIEGTAEHITDCAMTETGLRIVRPGSAIVGLIGQGPTRGMTARLALPATVSQNVAYVTSRDGKVSDDYLIVVLTGLYTALRYLSDGSGGAQGAMNCDTLRAFRVPIAPTYEQVEIVAAFRAKKQAVEGLQAHVREHIDGLREYRLSLVSDAVTGQLDLGAASLKKAA